MAKIRAHGVSRKVATHVVTSVLLIESASPRNYGLSTSVSGLCVASSFAGMKHTDETQDRRKNLSALSRQVA